MAKGIENRARSPPAVFDFATSQIQKHGGTKMYYDLVESGKRIKALRKEHGLIIDDDRRLNAERMEAAFYSGRQTTTSEPVQSAATESSADDKELLLKLLQNPEMAALLKSLAKTL